MHKWEGEKPERVVAQSLANIADTLAKLSMDACLYLNQNLVSFFPGRNDNRKQYYAS
jgi:hypothetical protein